MSKLALFGGPKVREHLFPSQNTYGPEEEAAVMRVMKEGRLSGYRANWGDCFYGGPEIRALEEEWAKRFNVKHAIACNSATSGLFIACGAVGVTGKEAIVTPYSMTCSATMPLAWGGIPVFADVEEDYFCLDPVSVEAAITSNTKAIIAVSIFGQSFSPKLYQMAQRHNIPIIEDAAQAIGSTIYCYWKKSKDGNVIDDGCDSYHQTFCAGTLGNIGVYSFNYGKHLTCGEGGMIVTDDDQLAMKCRLLMNHGESVQNDMQEQKLYKSGAGEIGYDESLNLFGFNLRMTEIQAAIAHVQLSKFDKLLAQRLGNVKALNMALETIPAITPAKIRPNCTHVYYVQSFKWDSTKADGLHRDRFIEAVKAELTPRAGRDNEGVPIGCGYIKPINQMPAFQSRGYDCHLPVVERLWKDELFLTLLHAPCSNERDMKDVSEAFHKVWKYRRELS